ncbi:hypothetical protein Ciccas_004935 [Cichlidogyrus casuarinus]|uniref:Uncharacterized protein n=1 Tax=Cichlidogyrus casuarinus TaxID=1844966 RepID=A0ABD2QA32_9PLAT
MNQDWFKAYLTGPQLELASETLLDIHAWLNSNRQSQSEPKRRLESDKSHWLSTCAAAIFMASVRRRRFNLQITSFDTCFLSKTKGDPSHFDFFLLHLT